MGGDGGFIWSAYCFTAILLGGLAMAMLIGNKKMKKRKRLLERDNIGESEGTSTHDDS